MTLMPPDPRLTPEIIAEAKRFQEECRRLFGRGCQISTITISTRSTST